MSCASRGRCQEGGDKWRAIVGATRQGDRCVRRDSGNGAIDRSLAADRADRPGNNRHTEAGRHQWNDGGNLGRFLAKAGAETGLVAGRHDAVVKARSDVARKQDQLLACDGRKG